MQAERGQARAFWASARHVCRAERRRSCLILSELTCAAEPGKATAALSASRVKALSGG